MHKGREWEGGEGVSKNLGSKCFKTKSAPTTEGSSFVWHLWTQKHPKVKDEWLKFIVFLGLNIQVDPFNTGLSQNKDTLAILHLIDHI